MDNFARYSTLIFFLLFGLTVNKNLQLEKDLTIGTELDKIFFGSIQNIDVDSNGLIYVSDWKTNNIRVFSKSGELIQTIGRRGRGPGEFEQIDGSGINHSGLLYAFDVNLIRVSIYDYQSKSVLRKTLNIPKLNNNTEYGSIPRDIIVFNQGGQFLLKYKTPFSPGTGQLERKQQLVLFNSNGEITKEPFITIREDQKLIRDQGGSISVRSMPFGRKSIVSIGPSNNIYIGWSEELDIKVYDDRGELINTISNQVEDVYISSDDLKHEDNQTTSFNLSDFEDQIPDTWPTFDWFIVDDKSRVWVAINTEDRQNYSLRIYNQEGKVINKATLPKAVNLKVVRNGYAYGIQEGKDGIQSVVRYNIE